MTLTESRLPDAPAFPRSVSAERWFDLASPEKPDPLTALKERFAEWNQKLAEAEELVSKHVFNNPDFSLQDARQHRKLLHLFLYKAEELALDFETLGLSAETVSYVTFLDEQAQRLARIFQDWHGDPEAAADIPESFKQAMREAKAGQTEEMEEDLFAPDTRAEA